MYKILVSLMAAILIIGAAIAVIRAAIGFFTINYDMIYGAILLLLVSLVLAVALAMVLGLIDILF